MKRRDLIRAIKGFGCILERHGARHDWWRNPATGEAQPVPRHTEVKEHLARHIIRTLANPSGNDPATCAPGTPNSDG